MKFNVSLFLLFISSTVTATEFDEVVKDSVKLHYEYVADRNQVELVHEEKKTAYSRFLPTVDLSRTQIKYEEDNDLTEYQRSSIDLRLNLFSFGSDVYNVKRVRKKKLGLKNKLRLTKYGLERRVSSTIFRYVESKLLIGIYEKIVKIREQSLKIARKRYQSGQLSLQDRQKVEIDLNNAKSNYADQVISYETILQSFRELTGRNRFKSQWPWKKIEINFLLKKKFKKKNHPLNRYAQSFTQAAEFQKKSKLLDLIGDIDLLVSSGVNQYDSSDITDNRISIGLTIPLFNQFNDYYSYREASMNYQYQKTFTLYQARKVDSTYKQTTRNLKTSYNTYTERLKNLELSKKLFENSQQQFKKGRLNVNELLIEQDRLLRSQVLANSGALKYHQAIVNYCHSIGQSIITECFL